MAETNFGVASIKRGGIDAATGLPTSLTSVGDVYRDAASVSVADGTETNHYAELKQYPVVNIMEIGETTFAFSLLDTSADTLVAYCGGTVTTVAMSPDVWNAPTTIPNIEASFAIASTDGAVFTIRRGKVMGKYIPSTTRNGISLLEVRVKVMEPLVADVAPLTKTDVIIPA